MTSLNSDGPRTTMAACLVDYAHAKGIELPIGSEWELKALLAEIATAEQLENMVLNLASLKQGRDFERFVAEHDVRLTMAAGKITD